MLIINASSTEQASHDNQNLLSLAKAKICLLALIDCLERTHAARPSTVVAAILRLGLG
jgi:hypothetical protein